MPMTDRGPSVRPAPEAEPEIAPRPRRARRPKVVIFDFDGTLISGDSTTHVIRRLILKHPLRTVAAVWALPVGLGLLALKGRSGPGGALFVWLASVGRDEAEWQRVLGHEAERSWARARRDHPAVMQRLLDHLDAGDRVLISTGSADPVARRLCQLLELEQVPLLGGHSQRFFGGFVARQHLGENKVRRLADEHGLERWDLVYTDSESDLPLMQRASKVVLVDPSPRLLQRVRQALPKRVRIEALDSSL